LVGEHTLLGSQFNDRYECWTKKKRTCSMPAWTRTASVCSGIMAAILASLHMRTADDLFGGQPAHRSADCREYSVGGADHGED